jgi:hypothetical protein
VIRHFNEAGNLIFTDEVNPDVLGALSNDNNICIIEILEISDSGPRPSIFSDNEAMIEDEILTSVDTQSRSPAIEEDADNLSLVNENQRYKLDWLL